MVFGRFFQKKDHSYYLSQAEKHLGAGRFAEARTEFLEAQSRCPGEAGGEAERIAEGLRVSGDRLAELNLEEGGHALGMGDAKKARDHFALARELAHAPELKARAEAGLKRGEEPQAPPPKPSAPVEPAASSCASCKGHGAAAPAELPDLDSDVHEEDRYFLLVQPLPGDLPARYGAMGEEFITAFLLIHEGNDAKALPILQKMLLSREDDIVIYELALIMYRDGRAHECEELLNRALRVNPTNPAVYLALVHLKAEGRRFQEGIALLGRMMECNILPDQALFLLGDMYEASENQEAAVEVWTRALEIPSVARASAERLIPILASQGREADAKYLVKRFLKGCC